MSGWGPITGARPVAFSAPLPEAADVVIIGGGIIGVCAGWALAKAGLKTVLIEKGRVAAEQSSRNWGWIRAQGRDLAELPIMMEALEAWPGIAAACDIDIGLRQAGVYYLAKSAETLASYDQWRGQALQHGLRSQLLTRAEVAELLPSAAQSWTGALLTSTDMYAEPWLAVPAMARAAQRDGLIIIEGCAARGLDVAAGQVAGVVTQSGTIKTSQALVAAGAWSRLFLQRHGVHIPQLSVRSSALATGPMPLVHEGAMSDGKLAFRRRLDGGYTLASGAFHELFLGRDAFSSLRSFIPQLRQDPLGTRYLPAAPTGYPDAWSTPRQWALDTASPFEATPVLNPAPNMAKLRAVMAGFASTFPDIEPPKMRAAWAGMIDTMPDIVPVVDQAAALPGLTIGTGMSGHGFGIGPAFGRILADMIQGAPVGHDLTRFRLDRFGGPVDLGQGL